jgi:hypothetical protein
MKPSAVSTDLAFDVARGFLKLADADTPPEQPAAQDTIPDEAERRKRLGQHRARRQLR